MNRTLATAVLVSIALIACSRPALAQRAARAPTSMGLRELIPEDSLTPVKSRLRDDITRLRDTLSAVRALHARISRNLATRTRSVVLSDGRELGKRCHAGAAIAILTSDRVANLRTSDPTGDQALNAYRGGLAALTADLDTCQRDAGAVMATAAPDQEHIEQVAAAASAAIARYDLLRDALLKLLEIELPIQGTIGRRPR